MKLLVMNILKHVFEIRDLRLSQIAVSWDVRDLFKFVVV